MPIQKIKIDKSIISDMAVIPDNKVIINAIIGMSHNLGLKVMAEGESVGICLRKSYTQLIFSADAT